MSNLGPGPGEVWLRVWLAIIIVGLSAAGMVVISWVIIGYSTEETRPEMARLVFVSILPLLGTWVGTVLAFYFARENLREATDTTARLTRRIEPTTPVTQVMISRNQIISYNLPAGQPATGVSLFQLYEKMAQSDVHRIPILDQSDAVLYVVHDSIIDKFAASLQKSPTDPAFVETMDDLLQVPEFKKAVEAIAVVGPNAVVAEAGARMRALEACNDVFVTTQGRRNDPVLGWLTNTDLAGEAR